MKKRGTLIAFLILISISLVSALDFSIGDLFDTLGGENIILFSVFIILFAIINLVLSRVFRGRDPYLSRTGIATAGIIAFMSSALATYGLYRTGFDFESLFFDLGISEEIIYLIFPLVILAGLIYGLWKLKHWILIILGGVIFSAAIFTDIIYQEGTAVFIALVLILAGIIWGYLRWRKKRRAMKGWATGGVPPGASPPLYMSPRPIPSPDISWWQRRRAARKLYKEQLKERRYQEAMRQAEIKARAKNISEIREIRLRRQMAAAERRATEAAQKKWEHSYDK